MNGPDNLLTPPVSAVDVAQSVNHTPYPSQYFQMMDVEDQVFHVMVSRLTYDMCRVDDAGMLLPADRQHPLVEADQYYGEINGSAIVQESDYAPYKPRCDILFSHAVAYTPKGEALDRWPVGVRIGDWIKKLNVCGPRQLKRSLGGWVLSRPQPVARLPIRYELAWGGTCQWPQDRAEDREPELYEYEPRNPIGCGFNDRRWRKLSGTTELVAPCIEPFGRPFTAWDAERGDYPVAGLGAIGRWWSPRLARAGTYDEQWKRERWPRLPGDFDFRYWNGAPDDQQIDYPQGGEQVVMIGLHDSGEIRFRLPNPGLKLLLHLKAGVPLFKPMVTDTVIFDMQTLQLTLVQRALVSARAEVESVELGEWDIEAARRANRKYTEGIERRV